jgi:3-oxoacyl-[acyl-carrier-protein] synthase-1
MGHTLGAAGITESIIALDTIKTGIIPGSMNLSQLDDDLDLTIQSENVVKNVDFAMTNSFGFGGNNCSLVFGRAS